MRRLCYRLLSEMLSNYCSCKLTHTAGLGDAFFTAAAYERVLGPACELGALVGDAVEKLLRSCGCFFDFASDATGRLLHRHAVAARLVLARETNGAAMLANLQRSRTVGSQPCNVAYKF